MSILDFGNGYSAKYYSWKPDRELNPQYEGIPDMEKAGLILTCPHGDGGVPFASHLRPNGWTVVQEEPLTLEPSILRTECGCHGFIRNGRWEPA